jgi:uncharacterized protein (DUF1778 family)
MLSIKTKTYDRTKGGTRKPIQLLPEVEQHRRLRLAAADCGVPLTQFVLDSALAAAETILKKIATAH